MIKQNKSALQIQIERSLTTSGTYNPSFRQDRPVEDTYVQLQLTLLNMAGPFTIADICDPKNADFLFEKSESMSQITKLEARFRDARIRIDAITDIYHFLEALDPSYDLNQIDSSYKIPEEPVSQFASSRGFAVDIDPNDRQRINFGPTYRP